MERYREIPILILNFQGNYGVLQVPEKACSSSSLILGFPMIATKIRTTLERMPCQLIIFEEQQNCPWKHKTETWTYRDIPLHSRKQRWNKDFDLNFQLSLEDCWSRHVEATNNSYLPSIYFHGTLDCTTTDNSTNSGQERCLVDFLGHVASTQSKCFVNAALQCPGSNLSRLYIYICICLLSWMLSVVQCMQTHSKSLARGSLQYSGPSDPAYVQCINRSITLCQWLRDSSHLESTEFDHHSQRHQECIIDVIKSNKMGKR